MSKSEKYSFDATSKFLQLENIRLHYNEAGSGDALILLHGGGPGASGWSNFKQNLPGLSEHFRVLLVDQPMFGLSDKPDIEEHYFDFSAKAVLELMDALNIEKAHFLGNSLGGGTTFRFALTYPDRAARLVLMGPGGAAKPILSPAPTDGLKKLLYFYEETPAPPNLSKMRDLISTMVYDQSFVTDELVEERLKTALLPEVVNAGKKFLKSVAGHERAQLWREVHKVKHQSLITWGRDDRMLPLDGAFFMLQEMENARLHVFPRCGHWAQLEHLQEFNRLVTDFLSNELS